MNEQLLNFLIVRPVLTLVNFVRRHPWKTLAIVLLLMLTVGFVTYLSFLRLRALALFGTMAPVRLLAGLVEKLEGWLSAKPRNKWLAAGALLPFFPLIGWTLVAWFVADKLRGKRETTGPSSTATVKPEVTEDSDWGWINSMWS